MTITSNHNRKLKEIRKLRMRKRWRERAGKFVAEGEDLLEAADVAGWTPVERYCAAGSGLGGVEVEPELLASASGIASGTRALAVYEERWINEPVGQLCVYLHGVQDPGNVGSILRSAEAFGASCVVLGKGSADPYSPKAVRASMGAIFAVPIVRAVSPDELPGHKLALVPGQGVPVADVAAVSTYTLMVGAERDGLPEQAVHSADEVAHIPIKTDSLNAAMAATVALYELGHRISGR
jgi:TrmH family RNA methyltransferase